MPSQLRDIRWSKPALYFFKDYQPTQEDVREVLAALVDVRDHEDRPRTPVPPDEFPELPDLGSGAELFVCESASWRIVCLWLEEEIEVSYVVSKQD